MTDWQTYYNQHLSRPTRRILVEAVAFCKNKNHALDIGAGTLIESKFLLDSGFKSVLAVDSSPKIKTFAEYINDKRLEIKVCLYNDLLIQSESYDLVTAQYAIPFYGSKGYSIFIDSLIKSLKAGGVFTGQFFGNRDSWNTKENNLSFQTIEEAKELLNSLEIITFTEEEKDGKTASGEEKHWHVFHFIARKYQ